jgi:MoxR-like ATPase
LSRTSVHPPRAGGFLAPLGVYGFTEQEPLILAALVTGDPLLLIGESGTGKTFLLNTISEALGLEHRHYNASLIAFDDLVGFPYPDDARETVRFLQTPATVWGAESVLIDELSRCKPEHQNRLFSLIHERRVQGLALANLRYRWAAMNPASSGDGDHDYLGSQPLDPALADRFGLILPVGDWMDLSDDDRRRVADPSGEGAIAHDDGALANALTGWRAAFDAALPACPPHLITYVTLATTALLRSGVRLSPRRARLIARSLLAATIVTGNDPSAGDRRLWRDVLQGSIPHRAWGEAPPQETIAAAHEVAWSGSGFDDRTAWLHRFHLEPNLATKARLLLAAPDPDTGSLAVAQLLGSEDRAMAAAFAFAAFPAAASGKVPIGAEGTHDLGRVAQSILTVDGTASWTDPIVGRLPEHPDLARYAQALGKLRGARHARAKQLFYHLVCENVGVADPNALEANFHACVGVFAKAKRA